MMRWLFIPMVLVLAGASLRAQETQDPSTLVQQGRRLNASGRQADALVLYDRALKMNPDLFEAHLESRVKHRVTGRESRLEHPGVGHRSRCWLEQYPERRTAVLQERDPFQAGVAPAEAYHERAAARGERPADEPGHESGKES